MIIQLWLLKVQGQGTALKSFVGEKVAAIVAIACSSASTIILYKYKKHWLWSRDCSNKRHQNKGSSNGNQFKETWSPRWSDHNMHMWCIPFKMGPGSDFVKFVSYMHTAQAQDKRSPLADSITIIWYTKMKSTIITNHNNSMTLAIQQYILWAN